MANMNKMERDVASLQVQVKAIIDHFGIQATSASSERQQAEEIGRKFWQPGGDGWLQANGQVAPPPAQEPAQEPAKPVEEVVDEPVEDAEPVGEAPRGRGRPPKQ